MRFLFIFLFSTAVFGHDDCVNCGPELATRTATANLEEFSGRLDHWSASADQVMSAPCKTKVFNTERMNADLSSMKGKKDQKIGGVKFRDENPELLKVFRNLTTKNKLSWFEKLFLKGDREPETNFQAGFAINPACEKVLCAVDRIWGQFTGRKLLYMNLKFGYNGSEYIFNEASRFREDELDEVLIGLSDLPQTIVPMYSDRKLIKSSLPAKDAGDGMIVWADSQVVLYPPWINGPSGLKYQTLVHEVGHNLHYKLPPVKYNEWLSMSSWVKTGDTWEYDLAGACMTSRYSMASPHEDFAESVSAYRYNARALFARCPAKYNFIREHVFKGVEYREESQCAGR